MAVSVNTGLPFDGKHIRVVLEGLARQEGTSGAVMFNAPFDFNRHVTTYVHPEASYVMSVEIVPDPLKVGDELTGASLEPPEGTVVIDHDTVVWQRFSKDWRCPQGGYFTWPGLVNSQIRIPLTVLYVPEETQ